VGMGSLLAEGVTGGKAEGGAGCNTGGGVGGKP
jgi:hypothetical protein